MTENIHETPTEDILTKTKEERERLALCKSIHNFVQKYKNSEYITEITQIEEIVRKING